MKPSKLLLALVCVLLAASPAAASVLFKGLHFSGLGSAVAVLDPDGRLQVSNIGSSGNDGVSVSLLHMDGLRMELAGDCTLADAGARMQMTYRWAVLGLPTPSPSSSITAVVSGSTGFVDISVDVDELSSSPLQRVTLRQNDEVVFESSVPAGTVAHVALDASGSCPKPELSCAYDRKVHALHHGARFSRAVHVTVDGHDQDCDDIEFSSTLDGPDDDCDGVSAELRVTSPPSSSFQSVQCMSSECRVFDHFVQASGQAELAVTVDASGQRRLPVNNLGSSGNDGVEVRGLVRPPVAGGGGGGGGGAGGGAAVAMQFAPPVLYFDPATDNGASSRISIVGEAFSSTGVDLGPASASLVLTVTGNNFYAIPSHTGASGDQEWAAVISGGVEVARAQVGGGGSVLITPPPGEPLGMAINEKGLPGACKPRKSSTAAPSLAASNFAAPSLATGPMSVESASLSATRGIAVDIRRPLRVSFVNERVFAWGGVQATGDELLCWSENSAATAAAPSLQAAGDYYSGSFVVVITSLSVGNPNPAGPLSSLALLDLPASGGDPIGPDVSGSTSLSSSHTCVTVPMLFSRTDTTLVRGYSVTFHLSPELALCGAGIVEGDYLSAVAGTQMFVQNNGGGSYTVDCGILGPVCGATGDGLLFSMNLASTVATGNAVGVITVDSVKVRDCSNAAVVADPGNPGYVQIINTAPAPVADLHAIQARTGNYVGGTTTIHLSWTAPPDPTTSMALYRHGFGNYPEYDNGSSPGSVPAVPASSSSALASGWVPVTCSSGACAASSLDDLPSTRDEMFYVAFVRDLYGNESPPSNRTTGTLDYFLGDVSDGVALCVGDNHVTLPDISFLGAHYGQTLASGSPFSCLDVGPTLDYSVYERPTTDTVVDFEDFMMFAIDFNAVSAPALSRRPVAAAANASRLDVPALPAVGETFDVGLVVEGAGDLHGVSAKLAYDPAVLEQVGVSSGALLEQQDRPGAVLSAGAGNVDAALFGAGAGIAGRGEIARVTFRVRAAGDPQLALASIDGRDAANRRVAVAGASGGVRVPTRTALGFAYPNPFSQSVAVQLSLRETGPASIGIFDVAGRRVRTLVNGVQPAGARLVTWDGRDDAGVRLAPGAYIVRLEAGAVRETRTIRLVR